MQAILVFMLLNHTLYQCLQKQPLPQHLKPSEAKQRHRMEEIVLSATFDVIFLNAIGTLEMLLIAKIIGVFSSILILPYHGSHTRE